MSIGGDERAVSVQIGAVLLLAIIVAAMALWQVNVVPEENADVEIQHQKQVQAELLEVRNGIVSAPGGGSGVSQTISLGTSYPPRSFLVNPPDPTGTLWTVGTDNETVAVTLANASATDEDAADFWNGTNRSFATGALAYEPNYNEYRNPPTTVYENGVLYYQHDTGESVALTGQQLISGNRISIVTLDGQYAKTASSASLDVEPISTSTNTVSVRNDSANVTITIPTRLSAGAWEDILRDEHQLANQSGHVLGVESGPTRTIDGVTYNLVEFRLEPGVTYELEMAKVGIGSSAASPSSAYLTKQEGDNETVATGEDHELVVEVRDEYNNPVSDVTVNASIDGVGTVSSSAETGGDGRATLIYNSSVETPDDDPDVVEVNFTVTPGEARIVEFTVEVSNDSDDSNGGSYDVYWDRTRIDDQPGISCTADGCLYNLGADSVDLTLGTSPAVQGADVDYSLEGSGASISPSSGETDSDGENVTTLHDAGAIDGDVVHVHANSGGDGEALRVEFESAQFFDVTVDGTNSPVTKGDDLIVDVTVENTGSEAGTQDVEFDFDADGLVEVVEENVTLDPGQSQSITFTYNTTGESEGDHDVAVSSDNTTATETVTITDDDPYFEVSDLQAPASAVEGETITVNATIENVGSSSGTQIVEYRFDGAGKDTRSVTLDPGQSTTVEFTYTISESADTYTHGIFSENDSATATIDVVEPAYFAVYDFQSPSSAGPDETITVNATIENTGGASGTQTVEYRFDGAVKDTRSVTLDPGQSTTVEFTYTIAEGPGTYTHGIYSENDSATDAITVEDLPAIDHRIDDISHEDSDTVEYVTSYNISDTNSSFKRVDVVYENVNDASATDTGSSTATRDAIRYANGYGYGDDYEITVQVIYEDADGNEYVAQDKTISDAADTSNPGSNEDLSTSTSPQITSFDVTDTSNLGQGPRFDVSFQLSSETDFSEAELLAIGQGSADVDRQYVTTSGTYELNPDYGLNQDFVVAVLVYDGDGVVVDARRTTVRATA